MKQNNISNNDKFYRIQDGGKIYEAIIDNEIYKFNYYKTKDNYLINIFITSKDKDDCVYMAYKNLDKLEILALQSLDGCIFSDNIKTFKTRGNIIMKMIIKFAKSQNFKSIELEDISKFYCKDNKHNLSYEISKVHTLSYGYPWYYKFGFRYISEKK